MDKTTYLYKIEGVTAPSYITSDESSIEDILYNTLFGEEQPIALDTETTGLDPIKDNVIMIILSNGKDTVVADARAFSLKDWQLFSEFISHVSFTSTLVLQNAKFDIVMLLNMYNKMFGSSMNYNEAFYHHGIYDTMLVEQVLTNGKGTKVSLEDMMIRYLGIKLSKHLTLEFTTIGKRPFTKELIEYGAEDVRHLCMLKSLQERKYIGEQFEKTVILENAVVGILGLMEFRGMKLDTVAWSRLSDKALGNATRLLKELDDMMYQHAKLLPKYVPEYVQGDLFGKEARSSIVNWNSPAQVTEIFQSLVDPKIDNVSDRTVSRYKREHKLVEVYKQFKDQQKLYSSYGDNILAKLDEENKLHTRFKQILSTGRIASSNPNMQQIPNLYDEKEEKYIYRDAFIPNYENWVFVSSDYSSQELCIIAVGSKDPVWLDALKKGEDLHSICAELVFKDEWTNGTEPGCVYHSHKQKCKCQKHSKLRTFVKTINFGLAYGMTEHKLADTISSSVEEAKDLIYQYFHTFPKIKSFLDSLGDYALKHGVVYTFAPFFRPRYFSTWKGSMTSFYELGKIERAGKNTPIQGSAADMTKLALIHIQDYILKENLHNVELVMTVHDQIDCIVEERFAEQWKEIIAELMEAAAESILLTDLLKCDVTISKRWTK